MAYVRLFVSWDVTELDHYLEVITAVSAHCRQADGMTIAPGSTASMSLSMVGRGTRCAAAELLPRAAARQCAIARMSGRYG